MKTTFAALMVSILFYSFSIFTPPVYPQIIINEVMYAPVSPAKEWFELKNVSQTPVNLQNWKWRDAAAGNPLRIITAFNIQLLPDSFAVVCEDSVSFRNQYPLFYGIVLQSSAWSALNNSGNENVVVYNVSGDISDSLTYNSSWGGVSGLSLERKQSGENTNNSSNWSSSVHPDKATPGKRNSVTPFDYDVRLFSFETIPLYPYSGGEINMKLNIRNTGLNTANLFSAAIYSDLNNDSIGQINERICMQNFASLISGDSLQHQCSHTPADTGYKMFIAEIKFTEDEDTLNNKIFKKIYISNQTGGGGVVINEIMYDPLTGHSEWLEILNNTGTSVNLKKWKYAESTNIMTISDSDFILNPGEYFIIAHDTSLYQAYPYLNTNENRRRITFISAMSLSNTGERIMITDSMNNTVDAVNYESGFHNPNIETTKGISLEKINPKFISGDRHSWSSSADPSGATPGKLNSIYTSGIKSESKISVSPNPFSPDGDGYEDFAVISYKLKSNIAQIRIKVFDIKGREVRTIINNSAAGSSGETVFNGLDNGNQKLRTGVYIVMIEAIDERGGALENMKVPVVIASKLE
ncbi:MAG TPA: lamin tail domain-containing protein [Ignavibacteria bacterium]|nr:lamin tail domain-containing protein [Ignavibacteria bacterium]HRK00800.1 lamin tail domain-containing protein [Ignavibacteria bacterium]